MYDHVRGRLVRRTPARAVVEAGGVGYDLAIPLSTYDRLPSEGAEVRLFTTLVVREDALRLFGFATEEERAFFTTLQSVSGVGPAVALGIVSSVPFAEFRAAVAAGDAQRLRRVRGVGKKLSERLVVELRDAWGEDALPAAAGGVPAPGDVAARDAVLALEALGFPRDAAASAVAASRSGAPAGADAGVLVRLALRSL